MSDSEKVVLRLNDGRDFNFGSIDEDTLRQLGPAILSHLGCSYQIAWPDRSREDLEQERQRNRQVRREKAEEWASSASVGIRNQEVIKQLMVDAYKAGWDEAPKPVRYLR